MNWQAQPPPKQVRANTKYRTALREGQHFLYQVGSGLRVLFRVHHVEKEEYAYLTLLDWTEGDPVPTGEALLTSGRGAGAPRATPVAAAATGATPVSSPARPAPRLATAVSRAALPTASRTRPWQPPRRKLWPFRRVRWDIPPPDAVRRD